MPLHKSPSPHLLAVLDAFKANGAAVSGGPDNFFTVCPCHEDDSPSLSIGDGDRGVRLHCHAGCEKTEMFEAVVAFTGLNKPDFFYKSFGNTTFGPPVTITELAAAKKLPVKLFTYFGIRDSTQGIQIPYWDVTGPPAVRIRRALKAGDGSFWQKSGEDKTKITAYGAWMAPAIRAGRSLIAVEGESDALTGWYYGLPVLGFPGKGTARRILANNAHLVDGISWVFVIEEPDDFKTRVFLEQVKRGLSDTHSMAQVFPMRLPEKDLSDLHILRGPEGFRPAFQAAWEAAVDGPQWPDPMPVPPSAVEVCAIVTSSSFPTPFKVRDVYRRLRSSNSDAIRSALADLETANIVRRLPPQREVGRPVELFRTNPKMRP
jgi:hypothetical protein